MEKRGDINEQTPPEQQSLQRTDKPAERDDHLTKRAAEQVRRSPPLHPGTERR